MLILRKKRTIICLPHSLVGFDELDVVNPESEEVETGALAAEDDVSSTRICFLL